MADSYAVLVSTLHSGARWLADDSDAVGAARDAGSTAAMDAGSSVNGGLLAAASFRLSSAISTVGGALAGALEGAGTTLTGNADRYEADDDSAAQRLDAVDFAGPR